MSLADTPLLAEVLAALGLSDDGLALTGEGAAPSRFAVTDLLAASVAAVGQAASALIAGTGMAARPPAVTVDRRLASLWARYSLEPIGWEPPPTWDAIAGDYRTADGWIRLHTNLPHHRAGALRVLACAEDRDAVTKAVATWQGDPLETAIHGEGGVAAAMRSLAEWRAHPNGHAVGAEPLVAFSGQRTTPAAPPKGTASRPLQGLRVLDLTRVLAAPVATRTLAGLGATVLRLDPPGWDEGSVIPDIALGKRMAELDLKSAKGRARFEELIAGADLLVHGYRPVALAALGYDSDRLRALNPALADVCLDAWGWTGPWADRRGFDSLVQMSSGIAHAGMVWKGADKPTPLPVQALDHATGYLIAAAALVLLRRAVEPGAPVSARLSLARTSALLAHHLQDGPADWSLDHAQGDHAADTEATSWGPARRLKPPMEIAGAPMAWPIPARAVGSDPAEWPAG